MFSIRRELTRPIWSSKVNTALWMAYRAVTVPSGDVVVIQTTQGGSLGDQAMLDVAVRQTARHAGGAVVVALPWGNPIPLQYDVPRIGGARQMEPYHFIGSRQARRARAVCFIGADVVDGSYTNDTPQLRFLRLADRAGLETACFGFSYSSRAVPKAHRRLLGLRRTHFFARDQASLERFRSHTGLEAELVADLAFLLEPELTAASAISAADWIGVRRQEGAVIMALNLGGPALAQYGADAVGWVLDGVSKWLTEDKRRTVLLVPHDFREDLVGDLTTIDAAAERLARFGPDRVHNVAPPFNAWDAKALAGLVDFSLTCRMHFMIACFGMTTPGLALAYQEKFEGMIRHFGLDDLTVAPGSDLSAQLARMETEAPGLRARIKAGLPKVRELSMRNFAWLT